MPNAWVRELCGIDVSINECVLRWFGHVGRSENSRIAIKVYLGECLEGLTVG